MKCWLKRWIIAKLAALIGPFALRLANVTGRACQHEPHSTTTHTLTPLQSPPSPHLQCNADFHNHVDHHNALCGVVSASSAWCTRVPCASCPCLLPCELCRLNGDCCSVALAVALCLKAVHILHNLLVPPLGITYHCYLSPTPAVAQLLVEIYRATWPEKEKFLCHTNLFRQCLLAGSQTDDWLNIQIHTHTHVPVCVCVCMLASFMTSYCHVG